jgi:hypothetical protein
MVVALAALATPDVVFQRYGISHRFHGGVYRLLWQDRAAKIGVKHRAR